MNYQKLKNSRLSNKLLEYRYFQNKSLNESTNFTMSADKEIIKMVDGKPEPLNDKEKEKIKYFKTTDDVKILNAIEILNKKFGVS
jgi:hypothetical protein